MAPNIKIYIVAGEPSGDAIGAKVLRAIKTEGSVDVSGVGGPHLAREGLDSLFNITEISHGGIIELIPHIRRIKQLIQMTIDDITKVRPDVLLTIDSPGFSFRIAKAVKNSNLGIKMIHLVAPSVWAWRKGRAKKVAKIYDALLTLFDFEPQYFLPHGLRTEFVGHPLMEDYEESISLTRDDTILLMPGSRLQEIKQILPILLKVTDEYTGTSRVVIPTLPHLSRYVDGLVGSRSIEIITNDKEKNELFRRAGLAIVASGTATLQLALAGCPMIVCYKMNRITYNIVKPFVKTKHIALGNIILNRPLLQPSESELKAGDTEIGSGAYSSVRAPSSTGSTNQQPYSGELRERSIESVIPELIQDACTAANIMRHVKDLNREHQVTKLKEIRNRLYDGNVLPSQKIARIILAVGNEIRSLEK
ncbi:MAG: lipid-A-disaccharide synthase [Holosporales bacterium]|jgi:lipid-A-disaccharide synthase|nr:lipid-A-disaccharide synthase [Holosporales bacterium]